jgi:hypothetical protein
MLAEILKTVNVTIFHIGRVYKGILWVGYQAWDRKICWLLTVIVIWSEIVLSLSGCIYLTKVVHIGSYNHTILNHEQRKLIRQTGLILFSSRSGPFCPTVEPLFVSCPNRYEKMWGGWGGVWREMKPISHLSLLSGLKFMEPCLRCLARRHDVVLKIGTSVRVIGFSLQCRWGFKTKPFFIEISAL